MEPNETTSVNAYGWPLVPSLDFPGERQAACPKCGSRRIKFTGQPMTTEFLNDRHETAQCKDCGTTARRPTGNLR